MRHLFKCKWRSLKQQLATCLIILNAAPVFAEELRILTSMGPSLTDPFVEAFRQQVPDADILVLNKNTVSGLEEITRGNTRGFDIFWASSPESFSVLAEHGGFTNAVSEQDCKALPPAGYAPFALSSIGWAARRESSQAIPAEWNDLLRPVYSGRIGMALPSRSGTTHMTLERFLQVRGWQQGWVYFMQLSENLSTLTSRSFGVIDGVKSDRFDIGLSIDFLAETEPGLEYRYGMPIMLFPAQIGLLNKGRSPELACKFIEFVLSEEGQKLLLRADIGRIPVDPRIRESSGDLIPGSIQNAMQLRWQVYNADLAQRRYWAVNALFDTFISDRLPRRRDLWARLRKLEKRIEPASFADIERLLTTMPIDEVDALAPALNEKLGRISFLTIMTAEQQAAQERWISAADDLLDQADRELTALEHGQDPQ